MNCKHFDIPFQKFFVDKQIELKLEFSPGVYFHGRYSEKRVELNRDVSFSFESISRVYGNMGIGGPVVGLIVENFYYAEPLN